jgi:hypothetical protein
VRRRWMPSHSESIQTLIETIASMPEAMIAPD